MKPSSKALYGAVSTYLCNFLDENGVNPLKVLQEAGLTPKTDVDWHTQQRWQPLEDGRWGRVVGREGERKLVEVIMTVKE